MIRPGDVGDEVARLQGLLLARGVLPPEAEVEVRRRAYGPVTVGAVRTFEVEHQLPLVAAVDGPLWVALAEGRVPAAAPVRGDVPEPDWAGVRPLSRRALALADAEWRHGVHEEPPGSNRGPRVDEYLL